MAEKIYPSMTNHLRHERERQQKLFDAQPTIVQRFLEAQARQLADGLLQRATQLKFTLPDRVVGVAPHIDQSAPMAVPPSSREQNIGGVIQKLHGADIRELFRHRLSELEQSPDHAVSVSASLIRHAVVVHMVHNMLPSGRSVNYRAEDDEEIPTIPVDDGLEPESAITAATDAIAEDGKAEEGRGDLLVPFVPAARKFYLPQWIAFGDNDKLLVNSVAEAEAHVTSMQNYVGILHMAVSIAPYMVADDEYQKKRYGMLGQLINQGRALGRFKVIEIIKTIKGRAANNNLNRGLSLSIPYFDDQELKMDTLTMEVIPAGRIMFVPAFVVRAARQEDVKVAQDTRLSISTRNHIRAQLKMLEIAFESSEK
jgi:hypothetical protein